MGVAPGFGAVEAPVVLVARPTISGNSSIRVALADATPQWPYGHWFGSLVAGATTGLFSWCFGSRCGCAGAGSTPFNAALDASALWTVDAVAMVGIGPIKSGEGAATTFAISAVAKTLGVTTGIGPKNQMMAPQPPLQPRLSPGPEASRPASDR